MLHVENVKSKVQRVSHMMKNSLSQNESMRKSICQRHVLMNDF